MIFAVIIFHDDIIIINNDNIIIINSEQNTSKKQTCLGSMVSICEDYPAIFFQGYMYPAIKAN